MEQYLKIGEMAQLNHVSTQTLRLYDKYKLLEPDYQDPNTGYRVDPVTGYKYDAQEGFLVEGNEEVMGVEGPVNPSLSQ